jgi:hypothetical protein
MTLRCKWTDPYIVFISNYQNLLYDKCYKIGLQLEWEKITILKEKQKQLSYILTQLSIFPGSLEHM